jgi:HD superfamily phosphohydrolase
LKSQILFGQKIFNDPVYGFLTVSDPLIQQTIDHPIFQRLSRISQVGLSSLVYPGSQHTRFHHAMGAMHLMQQAILVLRLKGVLIDEEEERGALLAILLHDLGHGPYSHTLEGTLVKGVHHEEISLALMQRLALEFHPYIDKAIAIFTGTYSRPFFHQLVSGQLDVDRLDYLMRDSFYTGVAEGVIGSERIIKMMNVVDERLVVEEKGIYSVENFLIARRLMYWQVYLHKTVLGAEALLTSILHRAQYLCSQGVLLFATPSLQYFLKKEVEITNEEMLDHFVKLDDYDIMASVKVWAGHSDFVLSDLCSRLLERRLFKVLLSVQPFSDSAVALCSDWIAKKYGLDKETSRLYMRRGTVSNQAYDRRKGEIYFLMKSGTCLNFFEASHNLHPENMTKLVTKHYLCIPKEVYLEMKSNLE